MESFGWFWIASECVLAFMFMTWLLFCAKALQKIDFLSLFMALTTFLAIFLRVSFTFDTLNLAWLLAGLVLWIWFVVVRSYSRPQGRWFVAATKSVSSDVILSLAGFIGFFLIAFQVLTLGFRFGVSTYSKHSVVGDGYHCHVWNVPAMAAEGFVYARIYHSVFGIPLLERKVAGIAVGEAEGNEKLCDQILDYYRAGM